MTPDLALTLSYQGISLLCRAEGGWHLLGEVSLETEDLAAELVALRAQAIAANGEGFATALVVPNDQIKYLTLPPSELSDPQLRMQAADALEEATPYNADQLTFDLAKQGENAQVAAVARETLAEAEAFAIEHAFNPVCFTAIPDEETFPHAPNFGLTEAARSEDLDVQIDPIVIDVIGEGLPQAENEPDHTPDEESGDPSALIESPVDPEPSATVATTEISEPEQTAPLAATVGQDPSVISRALASAKAELGETPQEPEPTTFASVRAQRAAPAPESKRALNGVTRDVNGTNAPSIPSPSDSDVAAIRFDPAKAVAGLTAERKDGETGENDGDASDTTTFASARSKTKVAGPAPKVARNDPKPAQGSKTSSKRASKESQNATVFAVRPSEVRGKPRYLGLILTTLLLVFLGLVALWASLFLENGVADLLGSQDQIEIVEADPPESSDAQTITSEDLAQADTGDAALTIEETDDLTALVEEPEAAKAPVAIIQEDGQAAARVEKPIVVTLPDGLTPDATDGEQTALLEELAPEELAEAGEDAAAPQAQTQRGLTPEEAETRYAATGIWQLAPAPLAELTEDSSDSIYIAAIDRLTFGLDAVALPEAEALATDEVLPAQVNPLAATVAFDVDERGLVVATREGALNAEGVMVYAGRPPVVPASYPKRIIVADALREANEVRLASVRPRLRPSDLLEKNERATFGGLSRAELASIRPRIRPQSAQDIGATDQTPTRFAVKTSLRPRLKPANIAQLAARATQNEEQITTAAARPVAAAVVPAIPTTASVARQATIQNAINLKKTSLIGVYGTSSNRRALVRLPSGRYKKVQVGDRIDGGQVAAIGEDELRYVKGGRNLVLKMPKDG